MKIGFQKKLAFKITTPEILCDLFSFLDKDQIERIQLVNQFWNNVIIRHKNILPLRQFGFLYFRSNQIYLYATNEDFSKDLDSYKIKFDGTNLSKIEEDVLSPYSQLTVDEVLTNLNDVVFHSILLEDTSEDRLGNILNLVNFVTTKTGVRFRGRIGLYWIKIFDSKLAEIIDNCIIVNGFFLHFLDDSYIREICENPKIVQLPSTPKSISFGYLKFKENDEVLNFTCNGKLNGANRVTIKIDIFNANYENFIREWFELYRTHGNPISLVGKFELLTHEDSVDSDSVLDAAKTFLNNPQLRVKYSLEAKEFSNSVYPFTKQFIIRRCVLHVTDTYALVIEMIYDVQTDTSSISASDFDQPPCNRMYSISFCVESL